MELSSFSENIVTVPFGRGGDTVDLLVNIDAFTPEFFRLVGKQFQSKMKELEAEDKKKPKKATGMDFFETEARALEVQREIYASLLSNGVLRGWTVEVNGEPVEPTKDLLMSRPPLLVEALWNACLNAAKTVKKRVDEETGETVENMHNGSMALRVVGQTG